MNPILLVWVSTLVVKLFFAYKIPLSLDESYYWVWAHNLQWSYFDHPPMVAWLNWLGLPFESFGQAVRWPIVIIGHSTWLIWWRMLKPYLSSTSLLWFMILGTLSPLAGFGAMIVTPDVPLVFFWTLGIWAFQKAYEKPNWIRHGIWGLILGLGFLSKYHIVLLPLVALLWFMIHQREKVSALFKAALPTLVGFLLASAPVWIWNYQHDWVSFRFQLSHGLGGKSWQAEWTLVYLLGQILLIFPLVLWASLRRIKSPPTFMSFVEWSAWFPLLFFLLTSLKGRTEANWPLMAHPGVLAMACFYAQQLRWAYVTAAVWMTAGFAVITQVFWPWWPIRPESLKTSELTEFRDLLPLVAAVGPIYAGSYQMAGKLSFESRRMIYKLRGMRRVDYYDFIAESIPTSSIYYVLVRTGETLPDWAKIKKHAITERSRAGTGIELIKVQAP